MLTRNRASRRGSSPLAEQIFRILNCPATIHLPTDNKIAQKDHIGYIYYRDSLESGKVGSK